MSNPSRPDSEDTSSSSFFKISSKYETDLLTLSSLSFPYSQIMQEKTKKSNEEHSKAISINESLTQNLEAIKKNISACESELVSISQKTESMKKGYEKEISILCKLKESEISSLEDEISYKIDLINFLQHLTSIEIDENSSKIMLKAFGHEMVFNLEEEDENNYICELVQSSKDLETLPDWTRQIISFNKASCPTFFYNIFTLLSV